MPFPLDFWEFSFWLAGISVILLVTAEMLSPSYGKSNIYINSLRLRNAARAVLIVFLATIAVRMISAVIFR